MQLYPLQPNLKNATAFLVVRLGLYRTEVEQLRPHTSESLWQLQRANVEGVTQQLGNRLPQQVQPKAELRRNPNPARNTISITLNLRLDPFHQIDLVVNLKQRHFLGPDLPEHRQNLLYLLVALRLVSVDYMQQ